MVTNPKNNHNPPKPEQTGLRLCKDNSYSHLHPPPCSFPFLPLSHSTLPLVPFHPFPCLIPPSPLSLSIPYHPLHPPETVTHKAPKTKRLHAPKSLQSPKIQNTNVPLLLSINLFFYRNNAISETRIRENRSGCTALKSTKGYASICICR